MVKIISIVFVTFMVSAAAQAEVDQVCRDGIGSVAVIEREGPTYSVTMTGPIVDVLTKRGLVYSRGPRPEAVRFASALQNGPWGTRIFQSDEFLTYSASWVGSALRIKASGGGNGNRLEWMLQDCRR